MLMQGETLAYTPNFSIPPFLDLHGLPAFIMLEETRTIGGEIKTTPKRCETCELCPSGEGKMICS